MQKFIWVLLTPFPLGIFISMIWLPTMRSIIVLTTNVMVFTSLILLAFPWLSRSAHVKPIYFEDLKDEVGSHQAKYQEIFEKSINFCLVLASGLLCEYTVYQSQQQHPASVAEIAAFVGGILSLFRTVQQNIGKLLLYVLVRKKRNTNEII